MILTVLRALNIPSRARPWASTTLRSRPPIPIPTDSRCTSETQSTASLLPNMEKSAYRRIIRRTTMTITRREGRRYEHHQRGRLAPEDDHSHARTHARRSTTSSSPQFVLVARCPEKRNTERQQRSSSRIWSQERRERSPPLLPSEEPEPHMEPQPRRDSRLVGRLVCRRRHAGPTHVDNMELR